MFNSFSKPTIQLTLQSSFRLFAPRTGLISRAITTITTSTAIAIFSAGLAVSQFAALSASAQYSILSSPESPFEWRGHVDAGFASTFETDTKGNDSFDSWTSSVHADLGGPLNQSVLLGVEFDYRYAHYDFHLNRSGPTPLTYGTDELPREPWGALNTVDLALTTTVLIGDKFTFVAALPIRYAGETGAHKNGLSAGLSAVVRWQVNKDLQIGAGIGFVSQIEESVETFPIATLDWTITDALVLRTEGSWSQGGNAILLWGPNKAIQATLSGGYERLRFRLDDNGSLVDRDGVGEITSAPVEIGLRIRLYEAAYFDFRVGYGFAGHLRVETSGGRKLYDERFDPAPRIGIALTIPFELPRQVSAVSP